MAFPQWRQDPVTGRWVVIAPERAGRPHQFAELPREEVADRDDCPFCPGHERDTPHELLADRDPAGPPDSPGWRVRVVPNKFPAVRDLGPTAPPSDGLFVGTPGLGKHEVIVESSRHVRSFTELSADEARAVLTTYRDRLRALRADPRWVYGMLFKNVGAAAGASLEHLHSQLLALPMVPPAVREELDGARAYRDRHGRCVFCDLIVAESAAGRAVRGGGSVVAFAPYASRFSYEMWVLPTRHASPFEEATAAELDEVAAALTDVLRRLERVLGRPAYNYFLHTAPLRVPASPAYHWHIEIVPRLTGVAGYEWGSGSFINPVPPEEAAAALRAAD